MQKDNDDEFLVPNNFQHFLVADVSIWFQRLKNTYKEKYDLRFKVELSSEALKR